MITTLNNIARTRDPQEISKTVKSFVDSLSDDRFFAFVGSNNERYHGIMIALMRKDGKYAILINNTFKPTSIKGRYFYVETVEEIVSYVERNSDIRDMVMGISTNAYYLQIPRKENMEINLIELVRNTYQNAGTKLVQLFLDCDYDIGLKTMTEALMPQADVYIF